MTRFMVWQGFGSPAARSRVVVFSTALSLVFSPWLGELTAHAEIPRMVYPDSVGATEQPARAEQTVTWHDSFEKGWEEARSRDLPMVIFITSDRCKYCDAMERNTWCDRTISQRLATEFVAIHLSPTKNAQTLKRIKITTFPTTLIGLPEGKVAEHRVGYQPVAAMHHLLSQARERVRTR